MSNRMGKGKVMSVMGDKAESSGDKPVGVVLTCVGVTVVSVVEEVGRTIVSDPEELVSSGGK